MKYTVFYVILIGAFVTYINGYKDAEEIYPEDEFDFWSTYKASCDNLTAEGLEELCPPLKQVYNVSDTFCKNVRQVLVSETQKLLDYTNDISEVYNDTENCVNNDMTQEFKKYKQKLSHQKQLLNNAPKTETCYKDVKSWAESLKKETLKKLDREIKSQYNNLEINAKEIKSVVAVLTSIVKIDNSEIEEIHEEVMKGVKKMNKTLTKLSKELIERKKDGETVEDLKEFLNELTKYLKKKFNKLYKEIMNEMDEDIKDILPNGKIALKYIHDRCTEFVEKVKSNIWSVDNAARSEIILIEKTATAEIFKLINNETLEALDCDDYIPYCGMKPGESFRSISYYNDDLEFNGTGYTEDHRYYHRYYQKKSLNKTTDYVHEIIKMSDTNEPPLEGEYIYSYKNYNDDDDYY